MGEFNLLKGRKPQERTLYWKVLNPEKLFLKFGGQRTPPFPKGWQKLLSKTGTRGGFHVPESIREEPARCKNNTLAQNLEDNSGGFLIGPQRPKEAIAGLKSQMRQSQALIPNAILAR